MADPLTLRIITPDRVVVDAISRDVKFPALDGSVGVLPRHAPLVAALDSGHMAWTHEDGRTEDMFVSGGFCEVSGNTVRIVTEASETASEIDVERAEKAAERARQRLRERSLEDGSAEFDVQRAEGSLRRALLRKFVANKARQ